MYIYICRFLGLGGLEVWGFRVKGLGHRVFDVVLWVQDFWLRFRIWGIGLRAYWGHARF